MYNGPMWPALEKHSKKLSSYRGTRANFCRIAFRSEISSIARSRSFALLRPVARKYTNVSIITNNGIVTHLDNQFFVIDQPYKIVHLHTIKDLYIRLPVNFR